MPASSTVRAALRPLRVLGLDPGSRITGFALVEGVGPRERCIEAGVIQAATGDMPARLGSIHRGVVDAIERLRPDVMAIEQVFVARRADSALKLGQARGAAIVAAVGQGVPVVEYAARRVKQAVTGSGAATKDQMQRMVSMLLHLDVLPTPDAADALAIALCHLHAERSPLRWAGPARSRGRWKRLPTPHG
jgi:crossover junction endodeoxyribonuclease RuvC